MKLQYIGRLVKNWPNDDAINPRLWNIIDPGNPRHLSSVSLETLSHLGVLPFKGDN